MKILHYLKYLVPPSRHKRCLNSSCEWIAAIVWEYQITSPVQCHIPVWRPSNQSALVVNSEHKSWVRLKMCWVKKRAQKNSRLGLVYIPVCPNIKVYKWTLQQKYFFIRITGWFLMVAKFQSKGMVIKAWGLERLNDRSVWNFSYPTPPKRLNLLTYFLMMGEYQNRNNHHPRK